LLSARPRARRYFFRARWAFDLQVAEQNRASLRFDSKDLPHHSHQWRQPSTTTRFFSGCDFFFRLAMLRAKG